MAHGELNIDTPVQLDRNPITGRFLKGRTSPTKGRKWGEWLSKEAQKKCLANLVKGRGPQVRSPDAGRPRRAVIAVTANGAWRYFESIADASRALGVSISNIRRCCLNNQAPSPRGVINTDHYNKGFRFYFEDDPIWQEKINKSWNKKQNTTT